MYFIHLTWFKNVKCLIFLYLVNSILENHSRKKLSMRTRLTISFDIKSSTYVLMHTIRI